LPYLPF